MLPFTNITGFVTERWRAWLSTRTTTRTGVAPFFAVAEKPVIAERIIRRVLTRSQRIDAGIDGAAHAVVAFDGRSPDASGRRIAEFDTVARVAVVAVGVGIAASGNRTMLAQMIDADVGGTGVAVVALGVTHAAVGHQLAFAQVIHARVDGAVDTVVAIRIRVAATGHGFVCTGIAHTGVERADIVIVAVGVGVAASGNRLMIADEGDADIRRADIRVIAIGIGQATTGYRSVHTREAFARIQCAVI